MGHILNHQKDLCERIADLPENKIHNIWFALKVVFATVAFVGVVTVWDTLPSLPAIHDVEIKTTVRGNQVDIVYKYDVLRPGDFMAEYTIKNSDGSVVHISTDTLIIGAQSPTSHTKMFFVESATWCVTADLSWKKGFSLRRHTQELPKTCFEVVAPVQ